MKRSHIAVAAAGLAAAVAGVVLFLILRSPSSPTGGGNGNDDSAKPPEPFPSGPGLTLRCVAWPEEDRLLAVGPSHYAVWEAKTGKQLAGRKVVQAGFAQLADSPVSPDGKRVVLGVEKDGVGRILSLADGKSLPLAVPGKGGSFAFLSWSPEGGRLLFLGADQVLHLWAAASGAYVDRLGGPADDPGAGQYTYLPPRNQHRQDQNVYFPNRNWATNPEPKKTLAWVKPTWSADGRYLLTIAGLDDNWSSAVVVVRDGQTGKALTSLTVPGQRPSQWAFSPDGKQLAMISSVMLGGHTSRAVIPWDEDIHSLSFVCVPREAIALRLIDPETGAVLRRLDDSFTPHLFAWSPDSKRLMVASKPLAEGSRGQRLTCWEASTRQWPWFADATPPGSTALKMAYSPDGKYVALTTRRKGPHQQAEDRAQEEAWLQVVDSRDGKLVLESKLGRPMSWGKEIRLWPKDAPVPLWAPAGNRLLVGSRVWDVPSGKVVLDLLPKRTDASESPFNAAWAPDGKLLATWQDAPPVRVWSVEEGKQLRQLPEEKQ
jgi:WD40 repeat protein